MVRRRHGAIVRRSALHAAPDELMSLQGIPRLPRPLSRDSTGRAVVMFGLPTGFDRYRAVHAGPEPGEPGRTAGGNPRIAVAVDLALTPGYGQDSAVTRTDGPGDGDGLDPPAGLPTVGRVMLAG